ncbi:MAG: class F sortase [Anaerolineales bacterium]|nr:class F sortase [Anaerolineales bacterium]MCW5855788.1 class F sortase [Anaerolineales bacterium]
MDCAGNPVVAYYNLTAEDLRLYVDNASACAATPVPAFRGTPEATGPLEFSGAAGSSPQISIDIHNIVHATQLDVDLVSISGGYSIVSGLPIDDLAASDPAATITVQCDSAPQALGTLVLATNDPVVPTVTYDLTCTALVPEFNGSPTAPGPLAFVDIAAATPQLTVQVTNTGDTGSQLDVSLASITTPGYSIVSGLPIDDLTTIGGSATITVQCDSVPQSSGTLVLSTNDPANPTVTYNLTCTAPASGGDSGSSSDGVGAVSSASKPIAPSGVTTLQLGRLLVSLPASAIPPGQTGCEIAVKEQGSSGEYGFSLDDLVYDVKVFCDSGELNIFLDALTVCIRPSDGVPGDKNVYHRHAGQDFRAINGGSGPAGYVCGQTRTLSLFTLGQLALPATGFAPGVVTDLGAPSVAYAASDLTLSIPKLGLNPDILGVPQGPNGWDVSWLSSGQAGYLYGTAFPTWAGNSVLTAHVWNADNTPGPFHALKTLQHGDRFTIAYGGNTYTYEVRSNQLVLPSSQRPLAESEYSQITLVTCESFDPATGDYRYRRAVQAVLVDVY